MDHCLSAGNGESAWTQDPHSLWCDGLESERSGPLQSLTWRIKVVIMTTNQRLVAESHDYSHDFLLVLVLTEPTGRTTQAGGTATTCDCREVGNERSNIVYLK